MAGLAGSDPDISGGVPGASEVARVHEILLLGNVLEIKLRMDRCHNPVNSRPRKAAVFTFGRLAQPWTGLAVGPVRRTEPVTGGRLLTFVNGPCAAGSDAGQCPQFVQFRSPALAETPLSLRIPVKFLRQRLPRPAGPQPQGKVNRPGEQIASLEGQRRMDQRQPPQPNRFFGKPRQRRYPAWIECPVRRRLPCLRREKLGVCRQVRVSDAAIGKTTCQQWGFLPNGCCHLYPRGKAAQRVEPVAKTAAKVRQRGHTSRDFPQRLGTRVHCFRAFSIMAWIAVRSASGISSCGKNRW